MRTPNYANNSCWHDHTLEKTIAIRPPTIISLSTYYMILTIKVGDHRPNVIKTKTVTARHNISSLNTKVHTALNTDVSSYTSDVLLFCHGFS